MKQMPMPDVDMLDEESSDPVVAMTDEEIVSLVRREPAFFGHIVERYEEKLGRYITRLGVRLPEDRQDVLQEVFIKVYKNINAFNTNLSFSSWIYRIAHNEAINWYRKRNVRPEGHLVDDGETILGFLSNHEEGSEAQFDRSLNAKELGRALEQIDQKYQDVLILRFFEHKEYDEISDILQIPIGSVGTLIHRGKKQLAHVIRPESINVKV